MGAGGHMDYPDVLMSIFKDYEEILGKGNVPTIFNVVGSDNQLFAIPPHTYNSKQFGTVVVMRENDKYELPGGLENVYMVETSVGEKTQSSTKLTQGTFQMVIKDDLSLYKWGYQYAGLVDKLRVFYESVGYSVYVSNYKQDVKHFIEMVKKKHPGKVIVSLDKGIPGDINFSTSRVFYEAGLNYLYQEDSNHSVFNAITGKDVVVVDDDTASGATLNNICEVLEVYGANSIAVELVYDMQGRRYDVIDASDFTGKPGTGLVVLGVDGELKRVPYYNIDVTRFASVPKDKVLEFLSLFELDHGFSENFQQV